MRALSSAPSLMANPFVRTAGQLLFSWSLAGVALEALISYDKLKLGKKGLRLHQMLVQHIARDNSRLSLARRKDATCLLSWMMLMMSDTAIQTCQQRAMGSETMERKIFAIVLNVYQSTGIAKGDGSRQSQENHGKLNEIKEVLQQEIRQET